LLYPAELRALVPGQICAIVVPRPRKADWTKTKTQFVYRHNGTGTYYVRAYRQGKEVWKILETANYEVARRKAASTLSDIHRARILAESAADKPTFGVFAETRLDLDRRPRGYRH
jgi:hypothetical protein